MKISDNILVGVSVPRYCEFYPNIKDYIHNLNENKKSINENVYNDDYTLLALIVDHDDENVYEKYFILYNEEIYYEYYTANIQTKEYVKSKSGVVTEKMMNDEVNKLDYVFDMDHFIKNK